MTEPQQSLTDLSLTNQLVSLYTAVRRSFKF
jgi:hypothetical protein